jgi:hypothetical protein
MREQRSSSGAVVSRGRLDDSFLVRDFEILSRSLDQVSDSTCAQVWDPARGVTASSYLTLAAAVDSSLAEEWVDIVEQAIWAELRHAPDGPAASVEETKAAVAAARSTLPAEEQEVLLRAGRGETLSESDRCRMVRAAYHAYNRIPIEQRAQVLRRTVQ